MFSVACGVHNHLASEYLKGHSFTRRLSKKDERLIVHMFKSLIRLRDILHTLKQRNKQNVSTMRAVYNARKKFKIVEYTRRSQMQQLIKKLSEHAYIDVHRSCPDIDTVKDILWAHPTSIELLHAFLRVLIMDCT